MKGKVVLLTGGNSGIGKAAALELAKMGAELTLVCRNRERAEAAKKEVVSESGNPSVDLIIADLLPQREVRRAASEYLSTHSRLDVLINNAGSNFPHYSETEDGIESAMALNYFAPFLLTQLLLETLRSSAPSKVINVPSAAHFGARLDLNDLNRRNAVGLGGLGSYGRSKLALILFTYELARHMEGRGVTANSLHPGAVRTHIWAHSGAFGPLARLASLFMIGPEEGAKTTVYLASSPEVEGVTGKYFEKCRAKPSSAESYDARLAAELWDLSLKKTGLA
jgi:NAD(P)-dependent dehydrogenase (short-subunit alcohol dehydrogenase family)